MNPVLKFLLGWLLTQEQQNSARIQTVIVGKLQHYFTAALATGFMVKLNAWCGNCAPPQYALLAGAAVGGWIIHTGEATLQKLVDSIGQRDLGGPSPVTSQAK